MLGSETFRMGILLGSNLEGMQILYTGALAKEKSPDATAPGPKEGIGKFNEPCAELVPVSAKQ
jgi:hypothetical protein